MASQHMATNTPKSVSNQQSKWGPILRTIFERFQKTPLKTCIEPQQLMVFVNVKLFPLLGGHSSETCFFFFEGIDSFDSLFWAPESSREPVEEIPGTPKKVGPPTTHTTPLDRNGMGSKNLRWQHERIREKTNEREKQTNKKTNKQTNKQTKKSNKPTNQQRKKENKENKDKNCSRWP